MLSGEATPGSTVEVHAKSEKRSISPDEQGVWSIGDAPTLPFKLVVKLSDKSKELNINESQWTHSNK
jgi:hypothetical protein